MRLVMIYAETDECTYFCENTMPIEYESVSLAEKDFKSSWEKAGNGIFQFANNSFHVNTFLSGRPNREYSAPQFLTLDQWFEEKY